MKVGPEQQPLHWPNLAGGEAVLDDEEEPQQCHGEGERLQLNEWFPQPTSITKLETEKRIMARYLEDWVKK